MTTRRELTTAVGQRYQAADRIAKKLILDEFTKITGYHRKHAIRILTAQPTPPRERPAAQRIYREATKEALIVLWEAADRICGKRLKPLLPQLLALCRDTCAELTYLTHIFDNVRLTKPQLFGESLYLTDSM